jgi:hypothetical protein
MGHICISNMGMLSVCNKIKDLWSFVFGLGLGFGFFFFFFFAFPFPF